MASIGDYLQRLRLMHRATAKRMGLDLQGASQENRVLAASAGAVIATIVKALVDKGVITDADLEAAWQETVAFPLPREKVINDARDPTYVPPDESRPPPGNPVQVTADHVFIWTIREPIEEET